MPSDASASTPVNSTPDIYFSTGGKQEGPYPFFRAVEMMKSSSLSPESYLWYEGLLEWLPIANGLEQIEKAFLSTPPPVPAEPASRKCSLDEAVPQIGKRVTLKKSEVHSEVGGELLKLLSKITQDGELSLSEIDALHDWLGRHTSANLAALTYLRSIIEDILSDGHVSMDERMRLYMSIERVMPADLRADAEQRRLYALGLTREGNPQAAASLEPPRFQREEATAPQIRYIEDLGGTLPAGADKWEASRCIDGLLKGKSSVSNRQMMVLRFWNEINIAQGGKAAVCEWLDEFYADDPDRLAAWNLWKEENGDVGRQDRPDKVPIGIGPTYLQEVKSVSSRKGKGNVILVLALLGVLAALVVPQVMPARSPSWEPSEKVIAVASSAQAEASRVPNVQAPQIPAAEEAQARPSISPAIAVSTQYQPSSSNVTTIAVADPTASPLPNGKYFLLRRVTVTSNDGIYAMSPGTVVSVIEKKDGKAKIAVGWHEAEVDEADLTRNPPLVASNTPTPSPVSIRTPASEPALLVVATPTPPQATPASTDPPIDSQAQSDPTYTVTGSKDVHVSGYYRKDGTYVHSYYRRHPSH